MRCRQHDAALSAEITDHQLAALERSGWLAVDVRNEERDGNVEVRDKVAHWADIIARGRLTCGSRAPPNLPTPAKFVEKLPQHWQRPLIFGRVGGFLPRGPPYLR